MILLKKSWLLITINNLEKYWLNNIINMSTPSIRLIINLFWKITFCITPSILYYAFKIFYIDRKRLHRSIAWDCAYHDPWHINQSLLRKQPYPYIYTKELEKAHDTVKKIIHLAFACLGKHMFSVWKQKIKLNICWTINTGFSVR